VDRDPPNPRVAPPLKRPSITLNQELSTEQNTNRWKP